MCAGKVFLSRPLAYAIGSGQQSGQRLLNALHGSEDKECVWDFGDIAIRFFKHLSRNCALSLQLTDLQGPCFFSNHLTKMPPDPMKMYIHEQRDLPWLRLQRTSAELIKSPYASRDAISMQYLSR